MTLKLLALCLDCEEVFLIAGNNPHCPRCDSHSWWPLEKWLNREPKFAQQGEQNLVAA